jgi:peptidoglycan-associated lipoprotein
MSVHFRKPLSFVWIAAVIVTGACTKKVVQKSPSAPVIADRAPERPAQPAKTEAFRPPQTTAAPETRRPTTMSPEERRQFADSLARLEDALFDYDKSTIRPDAAQTLSSDVTVVRNTLNKYPQEIIHLEGHADQRGSDEYNLALGDRRAEAVKDFLVSMGIRGGQVTTVSYGKNRPVCSETSEECYQKNRRVHVAQTGS